MAKDRSLSGVAHDIAHHAGSGLSCLMPHLAQALREASLETTAVELLDEEPYPLGVAEVPTLRLVLGDLKQTALRILKKYGFERLDVLSSYMEHQPLGMTLATFCTLAPLSLRLKSARLIPDGSVSNT